MRVRFGEFMLDSGERTLSRSGSELPLEPKVFECLALLVTQAGKLTTLEQLRSALWPNVSVGDGSLRRVINEARKALGDTGSAQSTIRTRKGIGYVFVADVRTEEPNAAPPVRAWPFVGRSGERTALHAFVNGPGGLCLLSGEAGAGKTSLLARVAEQSERQRWLYAHCQATVGLPALWPIRELAAQLIRDPQLRARALPRIRAPHSVLRALPELCEDAPPPSTRGALAAEQSSFELCEAFAGLLCALAGDVPLLLAIEDVHWADAGSVAVLEAIARHARGQPLHVIATYRPESVAPGSAASHWIGRTSGRDGVLGVHLTALAVQDVETLLSELSVPGWASGSAQALSQLTSGNALFVSELVRHTLALGTPLMAALPSSLNHIVAQRVGLLPDETQRRLDQAAVLGHEFSLEVLAALAGDHDAQALLAALEPALRAGVLCSADRRADRLRFSHALVGDALVQRLTLQERTAHHRAALRAWQKLRGPAAPSGVLAEHAFEAGPQLASDERRRLCESAGRDAFAANAFDHAALHLGRALQLLDTTDQSHGAAELALLWARSLWHADVPEQESASAYLQAAERARRAARPEVLAEAAIGYAIGEESSMYLRSVSLRPEALELLEEAWATLVQATPGGVDALRGETAYRLAAALCWIRAEAGEPAAFERAAQLALRLAPPDPDPLRRLWLRALEGAADWNRTDEVHVGTVALMQNENFDPSHRIELWALAMGSRLTRGDLAGYERAVREIERLIALLPQPARIGRRGVRLSSYLAIPGCSRVMLSVIRGDFANAQTELTAVGEQTTRLGLAHTAEQANHIFCLLLQLFGYQGRASELEPMIDRYLQAHPGALWFASLGKAQMAIERGEREAAERHFRVLRESGFRPLLRGKPLLAKPETLVRLADVCNAVGTAADAAILYEALAPRGRECIQDGALICLGSCERALAELAFQGGEREFARAERHFTAALAFNTRMGHRPESLRTQLGWARLLLAQGRKTEADLQLTAAREGASALRMTPLLALAEQLTQ